MEIRTTDLALAATLLLVQPLMRIERDGKQGTFIFEELPKTRQIMEAYWRNDYLVSPQDYFNKLKSLKTRIHDKE